MSEKKRAFVLTIEKYAPPGDGLGFHEGKAVFVPATAVGDVVRVLPKKEKKKFIIGSLLDVVSPSPDRIDAPCPNFTSCGGCALMHLAYGEQLEVKRQMLTEVLGDISLPGEINISPSPRTTGFRYRAHLKLLDQVLGFSERKGTELVDIDGCLILSPKISERMSALKSLGRSKCEFKLLESRHNGALSATIIESRVSQTLPGYPGAIFEDYGFGETQLRSDGFAQSNPFITAEIIEDLLKETARTNHALELYCGSGTLSIPLAQRVQQLTGIDFNKKAIQLARENAELHTLTNTEFIISNLDKIADLPPSDTIVVDPPRKGLSQKLLSLIGNSDINHLVYISCNPATLARDIRSLSSDARFHLTSIKAYDMYCHSTHLEAMAVLER